MSRLVPSFVLWLVAMLAPSLSAAESDLPQRAAKILDRYCYRCHRGAGSASGFEFDVRNVATLTKGDEPVVVAKNAKGSPLWLLMHRGTMPPKSQPQLPRPTPEEAQIVGDWINAGAAVFPVAKSREFVSLADTLAVIQDDLKKQSDAKARKRQRYFTLTTLHNNPNVTDETLNFARAGLAKALNSLSWERELVLPRAVDRQKLVFAVDLEALGWSREHWLAIRAKYPYTLGFANLDDTPETKRLQGTEAEIQSLTDHNEPLYAVRADWFIAMVTQPPLYHALLFDLTLPELRSRAADPKQPANPKRMTATDLERFLKIDVTGNFLKGDERRVARAGFTPSGVSGQNRMIERHITPFGAYWKSYDFKANNRRAILSQFPLGPKLPQHPFPALAFEHDGGEIIFHLPNGLQGYLLIDGKDNRIDAGPIEVVSDALKTSGTPAIVNGLSCIACHKHGMIEPPSDEMRNFSRVFGREKEFLLRLYPESEAFQKKVEADRRQFLTSLDRTIGEALRIGDDLQRAIEAFPEPVSEVARGYLLEELDLAAVAAELHERDTQRLRLKIENDELLKNLGLGVLLSEGGKIKRAFWNHNTDGVSVMQLTASVLDYSTPRFGE
ncbi:MAG: c-type cytochrome domain-containing protein [Planctomycetaceae bacterium]